MACDPSAAYGHTAHFYGGDYPACLVADFIAAGLRAGDACSVILTPPNRLAVERQLRARGFGVGVGVGVGVGTGNTSIGSCRGTCQVVDTHLALATLVVGGCLDLVLARSMLTDMFSRTAAGTSSGGKRLAGDLAPTLFAAGQADDALAIERLVDTLAAAHRAAVFCAYPIKDVCQGASTRSLFRVCAEHASLEFPERLWVQDLLDKSGCRAGPRLASTRFA